ncbi:LysR family transcriptional regulator [Halomonas sp. DP5Y7-2]|uniref:LysR substrate-binding domain-containing protein n=1 Tax=Halomonas sp. DP5Y7-2 TaxID=2859076 RepID=UPI001C99551E|nr:LysR substrate-binding domain-containing protein [Halomonas sp. DP5Y7-2]MBY5983266.1 LysR family transcriptional regulator [Halomonas sp. DP5Y7-2]
MKPRHLPSTTTLLCFEAAARHLSFTRAAQELAMTQSAVSKQVAQLETLLQHALFRRLRRQLVLTPEGSLYLSEVRKILAQMEMSTNTILTYHGAGDVLKVATLPTFGSRWLAPRLPDFLQAHPDITLHLSDRSEAFDLTGDGIDVAVFHGHGRWPGLDCHWLCDEEVVAVGAPSRLPRTPELDQVRLLHLTTRPDAWHRWFANQGIHRQRSYHGVRVDTFHTLIRLAIEGAGLALIPRLLIEPELADGRLALASPRVMSSADAYYLVTPEPLGELARVRCFIEHLTTAAGGRQDHAVGDPVSDPESG